MNRTISYTRTIKKNFAYFDSENHQPVQLSGIRLTMATVPALWGGGGYFQRKRRL